MLRRVSGMGASSEAAEADGTCTSGQPTESRRRALELLYLLALKDWKVRYKSAGLGFLWALANPLCQGGVLIVIFSSFIRLPVENYPAFLLTAIFPWAFFSLSLSAATNAIVDNAPLIKKVYFPRGILPLSAIAANLANFAFSLGILCLILLALGVRPAPSLLLLPLVVLLQLLLLAGLGLLTASLNVPYRDVRYLVEITLLLWFYATPIFYPPSMVPARLRGIYMVNPMAGLVTMYRDVLLYGRPFDLLMMATTLGVT
ncbi:MAG: ABC transporter permease, partial [Candidatus Methylomirabilales bacterium]